ncbi:MAG TPA: class I SAM-dependent methyltransferase [Ktedonobacteraceae bacterium]|nr:class I SAM-dependent methyltransferase [Ktedonobacteraceae bacterium]
MSDETPQLNWHEWMQRWDQQQSGYLPGRERRFTAMLDALESLLPERFVAVDLACGPGSISQRLLNRFPQARCVAVDFDPVLLLLGQNVLGDIQGRLHWVEADLRNDSWLTQLGEEQVDAVLSTTALHWLPSDSLVHLYHQLGKLVRPGGVVLNGDHFEFAPHMPTFRKLAEVTQERIDANASRQPSVEDWHTWWERLAREPGMNQLFAERERRFIDRTHSGEHTLAELHEAALRDAGFREVGVIWQHMDNRVVLGVR